MCTLDERLVQIVPSSRQLALQQMVKHEFIDGDYRKQRTTWADGTIIEADLDTCEYTVK